MRKFIVYGLSFMVFSLLLTIYDIRYTIYASESSPSADPLRQSDSEASVKSKLEELKKDIASKAAKLKQEIDKKLTNKAYVGKVKAKSKTSITVATKTGPKIVSINQDTVFESKIKGSLREARKKYSQKLISEEDYLAALGDIDETQVLTAKKIILLDPKPFTLIPKSYLWGQIVAASEKLVTLKDRTPKNIALSLPNQTTVKVGDFVILSGSLGKNDIFKAEFVYVIPQGGFIKPKKVATPSAQVATKSATPSGKKR